MSTKPKTTKLQAGSYKSKGRPYQKFYVRLPIDWVRKLGLEKGSKITLELLPEGILIKK